MKFSGKRQDNFEMHLRKNRPEAPKAPENEAQLIWARIYSDEVKIQKQTRLRALTGAFLSVLVVGSVYLSYQFSSPPLTETEATLISDSLDLQFLEDSEDVNGIEALVTLAE